MCTAYPWRQIPRQRPTPVTCSTGTARVRHPETWSAADVREWVDWCVREYGIRHVTMSRFTMNGKALCLLTREDFLERIPEVGDVIYNALRLLLSNTCFVDRGAPFYPALPLYRPQVYVTTFPRLPIDNEHPSNGNHITCTANEATSPGLPHRPPPQPRTKLVPILPHPPPLVKEESSVITPPLIPDVSIMSPASTGGSDITVDSTSQHPFEVYANTTNSGDIVTDKRPWSRADDRLYPDGRLLWEFISRLLTNNAHVDCIRWDNEDCGIFRITNPAGLAKLWGIKKNRPNMTYEKLSRALRYYYKMDILRKVPGKRLTYRFIQSPKDIRKNQRSGFRSLHKNRTNAGTSSPDTPNTADDSSIADHVVLNTPSDSPIAPYEHETEQTERATNNIYPEQRTPVIKSEIANMLNLKRHLGISDADVPSQITARQPKTPKSGCALHDDSSDYVRMWCCESNGRSMDMSMTEALSFREQNEPEDLSVKREYEYNFVEAEIAVKQEAIDATHGH